MYDKIAYDIKQPYYTDNYTNDGQRFVAWYLRNIHGLDVDEAKGCITDGANDKQIDAVHIDNQNQIIYIIQGKFYSKDIVDSEPVREVLSSWIQIKNLEKLQESANYKLKQKINEIAVALEEDYSIQFELITTSMLTVSAQEDALKFSSLMADDEDLSANLTIVDNETLKTKYDETLNITSKYINHEFNLEDGKYMELTLNGNKAVIVAIALKDCVDIPGIRDGRLFRKNVRQSLGNTNKVNKGIAQTIKKDAGDFFFCHNGITAICSKIDIKDNVLKVKDLNVVNGCQSLTTINSCGEAARKCSGYVLFKFYELLSNEKADKISNSTNSQSAVKARDLRSNDKSILSIKKNYEQTYTNGYFITKRGESVESTKYDKGHIIDVKDLGKEIMAWHAQRPNISYGETKIFDAYFNTIFKKDYSAEDVQALNELFNAVVSKWTPENPLRLNESLLAMKSYAPFHQLYLISILFAELSNQTNKVPKPSIVLQRLKEYDMLDMVVRLCGMSLNQAFKNTNDEYMAQGKVFSPQNWIKNKMSITSTAKDIRTTINVYSLSAPDIFDKLVECCKIDEKYFSDRYKAD